MKIIQLWWYSQGCVPDYHVKTSFSLWVNKSLMRDQAQMTDNSFGFE